MRIWKYVLEVADEQFILMPHGARIISVQVQGSLVCLWAVINPLQDAKSPRRILTIGTGNPGPTDLHHLAFIGTYQLYEGALVFHVFEG